MPKVTMPQLGESVAEGTIGKWLKNVGDHVDKYEPMVEVITDKVNAEVPSPYEGTLTEILVPEGETVPNNTEIAVIETAGDGADGSGDGADGSGEGAQPAPAADPGRGAATTEAPAAVEGAEPAVDEVRPNEKGGSSGPEPTVLGTGESGGVGGPEGFGPAGSDERRSDEVPSDTGLAHVATAERPPTNGAAAVDGYTGRMTPAVRRLAREHGIDLALIKGTGHAGRVTRDDVTRFIESGGATDAGQAPVAGVAPTDGQTAAPASAPSPPAAADITPPATPPAAPTAPAGVPAQDELKPTTPMRRAIARHMVEAKSTAPHAYTTVEVDMSGVVSLRESTKAHYQAREGAALSFVAIIGKAVVEALRRHPDVNAHWTEEGLVRKGRVNLGVAVAVDDGLVVPVIHDADRYSIHGLNLFVQDFATRARAGRLRLEDIEGGTFTLNNTGWFGSVSSQPIVNVPEVAILSMEAMVKRPVVIDTPAGDTIGIRPMMNLCASFDHRATDGAQVGRFVQDVKRWLEAVDVQTPVW